MEMGRISLRNGPTINTYLKNTHLKFNNTYGLKNKRMGKAVLCKY